MPPKILLFGSGAIGTIYLYYLLNSSSDITAVCRSNYPTASQQGFHITSTHFSQKNIHIRPKVVRTPSEAITDKPFDFILITSKALPSARTPHLLAPAITPNHTTLVLIQNGIAIEDEYAALFPTNPILSCVVYLPVTQTAPGQILMSGPDNLSIGTFPASPTSPQADTLISLLTSAGATATFHPNIQEKRWYKLLLNAPWNPICALTLSRDVAFISSSASAERVIKGVLAEVCAISKALGYVSVNEEAAEKSFEMIKSRVGTSKGIEPSMLVDVLWSRRMEVEVILGNPVRMAEKLGIDVPRMEMLYALTKALDEAMQYRKPGKSLDGEDIEAKNAQS